MQSLQFRGCDDLHLRAVLSFRWASVAILESELLFLLLPLQSADSAEDIRLSETLV